MFSVLYCAEKYMVKGLEDVCREFISAQIDRDNVFEILEQVLSVSFVWTNFGYVYSEPWNDWV